MLRRTVLDRISSQRSLSLSDADTRSVDSKDESKDDAKDETQDERLRVVLLLPSFRRAALQVERILAACEFRAQQVLYRGIPASDPLAADLRFEYHLEPLWHLEGEWAAGRAVTCLTWNKENTDLLAVGYGKYLQQDQATGLVCMWSAKNPKLPERLYRFASPVSALSFCGTRPNLLAVGMCNGGLALLDVSATEKSVVADAGDGSESGVASPSWEPIWSMEWMSGQEFLTGDEQVLVTAGQDGRVVRWRRGERGLEWTPMLRVAMAEGGEKGVPPLLEASGHCPEREVGLRQFAAVLCMAPVPNDPVRYMVATEDGCVHTCSTNYLQRHKAVVAAHAGPVYRLSFSPFCEKIFLTCGADWTVRIWAVGLDEPLVTLTGGMQSVEDAVWSPRNSTILASISGDDVCMWDLRRKTYLPASRTAWPHPSPPTTLLFSPGQDNLLVGDREGRVAALALQHMPFAPYFQTKALVASLERALATKPALLAALKKRGEPFV
ncbi:WD repeat-containing protein 78-like [Thrips palmi]|uniref:Dynein axonemal intermediate chain 4 n=1 Tax=Thrips palmi TaxID=161013 RepID=A0A6P8ZH98_THRPL|nr:WD repeat-containing protein 78-like [Thrips palmi]